MMKFSFCVCFSSFVFFFFFLRREYSFVVQEWMIILLFLSFFLSKTKVSGFCARCFSVVVVVLRTETAEKLKKFCRKIKKKRNFLKHSAQTFYNTAVMSNN